MPTPVDQLLDIRGLDPGSWWPPAIGWWLVALAALFALVALRHFVQWLRRRPPRWQRDAMRQLHGLRRRCRNQPAKDTAGELSELLRRIAMARLGREACAGLTGKDWLAWLADELAIPPEPLSFEHFDLARMQVGPTWLQTAPLLGAVSLEVR